MNRTSQIRVPSYRRHKPTGQAVVTLNGRDHYLGRYCTPASRAEYSRIVAEWLAGGGQLPTAGHLTVNELLLAYWRRCELHYRLPDGTASSELHLVKYALKPLRALYGTTPAANFSPLCLKAVRLAYLDCDMSRGVINGHVGRIKRLYKWAVSNELVPPSTYHGLQCVTGLQRCRSEARETEPVQPVPEADIEAVKPFVSRQVAALIDVQLMTGCRPGEACILRACDLDVSGRVWTFIPQAHKTKHYGHKREIYLGPRAQEVIRPFLTADLQRYLFSPYEARQENYARLRQARKTKVQPSQEDRRKQAPKRLPRDHYDVASYRRAIAYGCQAAAVKPWHPHQLRHNAATNLRREHGVELARIILGHRTAFTTEIYAEADRAQAREVIGLVG